MASEWELGMGMGMGMGMEFGFGMGMGIGGTSVVAPSLSAASAHAPSYAAGSNSPAYLYGLPSTDTLRIDDLLDFSNHEVFSGSSAAAADNHLINYRAAETSSVTGGRPFAGESGSHVSSFADDIYIPTEEAAELEWLSKFVEDSFSDVPYPASSAAYLPENAQIRVGHAAAAPGLGTMSKRSRSACTNFTPNLAPNQSSASSSTSSSSSSDFPPPPAAHISGGSSSSSRKKGVSAADGGGESMSGEGAEGGVRRCTHCASEKTPQWRTGPLGPKTLCNACGVRYKSGRLVPEYRPAASPTFVLTQHSNSHRKVLELRRKKEHLHVLRHENAVAGGSASRQPEIFYHN